MTKEELRKLIRLLKNTQTTEGMRQQSEIIMARLLTNPAVVAAKTILMYYSLDDEVCTHYTIDTLIEKGKKVLLPAVINNQDMELRCYTGPHDLQGGFFHIMEPIGEIFNDYEQIDVAVVPGMSFDTRGNRLGRGKGYYDRFLPKLNHAYKIGVCFDFQKMPGVPADEHDIKMDLII